MRFSNFSSIWHQVIIGRKASKNKRSFLGMKSGVYWLKTVSVALGVWVLLGMGSAFADDNKVKVKGMLLIDYEERVDLFDSPLSETIIIPDRKKFDGLRVPRFIDSMPFRGEEFTINTQELLSCAGELGNAGMAYLVLHQSRGDGEGPLVLKAKVLRDVYECLESENNEKMVMPFDPFSGNPDSSHIGGMMWILKEILLSAYSDGVSLTNETHLRDYFNISGSHVLDRVRLKRGPQLLDGENRNVVFREITLRFRENGKIDLLASGQPELQ